jgi:hypothetical protein
MRLHFFTRLYTLYYRRHDMSSIFPKQSPRHVISQGFEMVFSSPMAPLAAWRALPWMTGHSVGQGGVHKGAFQKQNT